MSTSLSQEEIDALVRQTLESDSSGLDGKKIKPFDFRFNKRLDKFSSTQVHTLRTLHENFTRLLNNTLSVYLRTRVEASILTVDQISYGDFIASATGQSILSIFSLEPLPGSGVLQIDMGISYCILDRLLGGPGWIPEKYADLTEMQRSLLQRFLARMLNSYRESWNYLMTLSLKIEGLDSDPQFIPRIIPLEQMVACVSMELKVGDNSGVLNFCLPYIVFQSVASQLTDFTWSPSVHADHETAEEDVRRLERSVEEARVDVEVEMGEADIRLRDLVGLQIGDVLLFDKLIDEPFVAKVNAQEKFHVFPGVNKERLAVQVSSPIVKEEE